MPNVDEMPAGREMDALVAETVMGWTEVHNNEAWGDWAGQYPGFEPGGRYIQVESSSRLLEEWPYAPVPHYSTRIDAAWEVAKVYLHNCTFDTFDLQWAHPDSDTVPKRDSQPWCAICIPLSEDDDWYMGYGDTPMLAICRAALKMVNNSVLERVRDPSKEEWD